MELKPKPSINTNSKNGYAIFRIGINADISAHYGFEIIIPI
ncbi:hypothetical protein [Pseudanabaena sp. ABRG5-3]|nr:hypothetical protein [Pseudanabaena sp. ABRG5-3]